MAFETITPATAGVSPAPRITIHKHRMFSITHRAHEILSNPDALLFEWDPDLYLLRVTGVPKAHPSGYRIVSDSGKLHGTSVRAWFEATGFDPLGQTRRVDLTAVSKSAAVADLSVLPARCFTRAS